MPERLTAGGMTGAGRETDRGGSAGKGGEKEKGRGAAERTIAGSFARAHSPRGVLPTSSCPAAPHHRIHTHGLKTEILPLPTPSTARCSVSRLRGIRVPAGEAGGVLRSLWTVHMQDLADFLRYSLPTFPGLARLYAYLKCDFTWGQRMNWIVFGWKLLIEKGEVGPSGEY